MCLCKIGIISSRISKSPPVYRFDLSLRGVVSRGGGGSWGKIWSWGSMMISFLPLVQTRPCMVILEIGLTETITLRTFFVLMKESFVGAEDVEDVDIKEVVDTGNGEDELSWSVLSLFRLG